MEGAAAATTEKRPGVIVSAGQPTRADMTLKNFTPGETEDTNNNGGGAGETEDERKIREAKELEEKNKPLEVSDDQLKEILKGKGIELDDKGLDGLKEKLKPAPASKTADEIVKEKAEAETAIENRMVQFYLENGGTAEQFAALKAVANSDLKSLSVNTIKKEMKDEGFDDDEIAAILKERYYQLNPDEIKIGADEEEVDFEKRKAALLKRVTYGSKELENHTAPIKGQAVKALADLRKAIEDSDLQKQNEAKEESQISSKVEEVGKALPRKMTFDLGKVNENVIEPIEYIVTEDDIAAVVDELKDPAKRKQFLYTNDDSLNISALAEAKLRNRILETALKAAYLEGGNRQVAAFEKVFPGVASQLGVGGNGKGNIGKKGKIVSAGEPTPMQVKVNN